MKKTSLFKTFALPLFAAATLITACSSDDSNEMAEEPAKAPTTIHVSVGAEIAANSATRATYEHISGTDKDSHLVFETGDKLYLELSGAQAGATYGDWLYKGVLEYKGDGVFEGDMTAVDNRTTTGDIVKAAETVSAYLLPKGYDSGTFISTSESLSFNYHKAFAAGDKGNSVAQVCQMSASAWTDGTPGKLTLDPQNAVIYFTVSGLAANTDYPVKLEITGYPTWEGTFEVDGTATSDVSGIATFCIGIGDYGMDDAAIYHLTIDGQRKDLGTKTLAKGKVYRLDRFITSEAAREAVDLGLSVNWLKMNVGARAETDWGLVFTWGDRKGFSSALGDVVTEGRAWKAADGYDIDDEATIYEGSESTLPSTVDAAYMNLLDVNYRMPTQAEWQELIDNCTWTYTESYQNSGVAGYIATSTKTGYTDKSIFLPVVPYRQGGTFVYESASYKSMYYWSSTKGSDATTPKKAYHFTSSVTSGNITLSVVEAYRTYGMSVRGVKTK